MGHSPTEGGDRGTPVGNAPPGPRWPLVATGVAWLAWIGFMLAMVVSRTCTLPA